MILFLLSGLDCVKVVKYKSNINGSLTISNFSLDSLDEFSLCLRVFSYSFSSPKERSVQSLVRVGDRTLLGIVTHQQCNGCNTREFVCQGFSILLFFYPEAKSSGSWEHGRVKGFSDHLRIRFEIWKPRTWNSLCVVASYKNRKAAIFLNGIKK